MPKLKTVKGVKDRIKVTGTGKLISRKAGKRHLLTGRPTKLKRHRRKSQQISGHDAKKIRLLLPYR